LDVFAGLGDSITPGRVLEPLPAEGFTAAPGPDHEPVRAEPATTSVTQFFAGSELVVVFDPDDPDGGLPGMFSHALLPGASFDDNFNGTKSLRWNTQSQTGYQPDQSAYRAGQ